MPTLTPQDFVSKWKRADARERQSVQEHFIDLCALFDEFFGGGGNGLDEQRDRWLNAEGLTEAEKKKRTLTNLYNARPTWLHLAHQRLDAAVFAAYGWQNDLSDKEILEKLLTLNLERSK